MKLSHHIRTEQHSATHYRRVTNKGIMLCKKLPFNNFTRSITLFQDQLHDFHLSLVLTGTIKLHLIFLTPSSSHYSK